MSPRVIQLPMSGRDRRHYARQLKIGEQAHRSLVQRTAEAYRAAEQYLHLAHRLSCEEWSARQFIGGDHKPSPTIATCLLGGCDLLEVQCKRCGHSDLVDLTLVIWPRDNQLHTLGKALRCKQCGQKGSTNLTGLRTREPDPQSPGAVLAGHSARKR